MNNGKLNKSISTTVNKYLTNLSNKAELDCAIEIFSDPHNILLIRPELFKWWNLIESVENSAPELEHPEVILDKIHHRINLESSESRINQSKSLLLNILKIAAILVTGVFIGIMTNNLKKIDLNEYTYKAPKGSISQMVLPDNSVIYLNSGSELKYTDTKKERKIYLNGEAWFDVTKDEKKQFIVQTPGYDVIVSGTQFNVKSYPNENEIITTLEEGSVNIMFNDKLNQTKTIYSGQQLTYNVKNHLTNINEVKTGIFTAWKDNKLIFINMNLKELIVLLERKYGVDIKVDEGVPLDYHYDGIIKNETILEVLEILSATLPISYKIERQIVIITNK